MRFLHRHCTPRAELHAEMRRYKAAAERGDYWERQYKVSQADAARASVREATETIDRIGGEVVRLAEELTQAKKGREDLKLAYEKLAEQQYQTQAARAQAEAQLVDLRGAGVLTRDDIVSVLSGWSLERLHILSSDEMSDLVDALLAAQRKPSVEALDAAIETVTEGVTQEVGE